MTKLSKLYDVASEQLASVDIPEAWDVDYTTTASPLHEPCVRFSRVFEGEEHEVSFVLPNPLLAGMVRKAMESNTDELMRARRAKRETSA